MEDADYKSYHESLTSNNNGTTALESTAVTLPSIISLYIVAGVRAFTKTQKHEAESKSDSFDCVLFVAEFMYMIMPSILSFTVMADHLPWMFVILLVAAFMVLLRSYVQCEDGQNYKIFQDKGHKTFKAIMSHRCTSRRRSLLTNFRAITNMLTVLCILAVDFHIFPRRFAKTETFGYGVMDLGVGLFIIANALVAPETHIAGNVEVCLRKAIIHSIPLIILGAGRVFFTNQVNYQEHVTEYGQHWNFFFTLAVTKLLCSLILKFVKQHTGIYMLITVILLIFYEIILHYGVREWILSDTPRLNFVSANREGLASNIGYTALYFGGVSLGRILQKWERFNAVNNLSAVKKLFFTTVFLWIVTVFCENTVGISRRLANMGYFFWILSFTTTVLAMLLIVEFFIFLLQFLTSGTKKPSVNPNVPFVPKIMEAINTNGLLFFLMGNVLTGIINMSFQTFSLHSLSSFLIVTMYMFLNCATVTYLLQKNISLKI